MTKVTGAVKIGDFSKAMGKLMVKYTRDVEDAIAQAAEMVAKDGVKDLKAVSKATFTERSVKTYHKGWSAKNESVRHRARWVLHHRTKPGLPHLLENGHAKAEGGRVAGRTHIKPIEEQIIKDYEENVKAIIEEGFN